MSLCHSCNKEYEIIIVCPYCTISQCKKCVKSILEKQIDLPECNHCHSRWTSNFLKILGHTFMKEHVQPKIKFVLWEKEQPFLVINQPLVEKRKQHIAIQQLIAEKEMQLKEISREILYLKKQLSDMLPSIEFQCPSSSSTCPSSSSTCPSSSSTPSLLSPNSIPNPHASTQRISNPYIRTYCPSYSKSSEPSNIDLLLKIDTYAPVYKKKTEEWYSILDIIKKKQRHITSEPIRNEWRIHYLMKELSEDQYCSKLYDIYKDSEKKQDEQERLSAYVELSCYFLTKLDIYLDNYLVNKDNIRTLFETEEEMRSELL